MTQASLIRAPNPSMMGAPEWWHHHGMKMCLSVVDLQHDLLLIAGSAAHLIITRHYSSSPRVRSLWKLEWEVRQSQVEKTNGVTVFSEEDLELAFGLRNESEKDVPGHAKWLFSRFGCETARQFKYIRWGSYLNIPCPGTGHDGDPNISIELDASIQNAIRKLLKKE